MGLTGLKPCDLMELVCDELELAPENLTGPRRYRCIAEARWIVAALFREKFGMTTEEIGARIKKDHSTVSYGIKKIMESNKHNRALYAKFARTKMRVEENKE